MNTKTNRSQAAEVRRIGLAFAGLLWLGAIVTQAATTRYVALGGTNDSAGGYTSWSGAATNIQLAVNAATNDDTVLVSNGVYMLTNQLSIATNLTIRSYKNGAVDRDGTIINGNNFAGKPVTNRCLYLNYTGTLVEGFTITNGYMWDHGGGVYVNAGTLRNCLVTGNTAASNNAFGGGIYAKGSGSLITNCDITGNSVNYGGAGVYLTTSAQLWNSRLSYNYATNTAGSRGGGVYLASGTFMQNCIVISNTTVGGGNSFGGGIFFETGTAKNCLVIGNSAYCGGGLYAWFNNSTIDNCTFVSNRGGRTGIDLNSSGHTIRNTIACYNLGSDVIDMLSANYYTNCCFDIVTYGTTRVYPPWRGSGNIETNNPGFASLAGQNYRLAKGSPCINRGLNQAWMTGVSDLDGRQRVDGFSKQVDIGAYEFLPTGTMFLGR